MSDVKWWREATTSDYHSSSCDCESCIDDVVLVAADRSLWTLTSNLVIGAALCRADRNGYGRCANLPLIGNSWSPGCGRAAP